MSITWLRKARARAVGDKVVMLELVEIVVKVPHLERKQVADMISKSEKSTCDGMFWQGAT